MISNSDTSDERRTGEGGFHKKRKFGKLGSTMVKKAEDTSPKTHQHPTAVSSASTDSVKDVNQSSPKLTNIKPKKAQSSKMETILFVLVRMYT